MKNAYTASHLSLTNMAPLMLQTLPADGQESWNASAVWGTKGKDEFHAPWDASAAWGTKSADFDAEPSVLFQINPDTFENWMKLGPTVSRMIN